MYTTEVCRLRSRRSHSIFNLILFFCLLGLSSACELLSTEEITDFNKPRLVTIEGRYPLSFKLNPATCKKPSAEAIKVSIASIYGDHVAKFTYSSESTTLKIGQDRFVLPGTSDQETSKSIIKTVCAKATGFSDQITIEAPTLVDHLHKSLSTIAPGCSWQPRSLGWFCQLEEPNEDEFTTQSIHKLQKDFLRAKNRHSYPLARRIALARKVLQTSKNLNLEALHGLCQIIELSTQQELPTIMNSQTWRQKLCSDSPQDQSHALLRNAFHESYNEAKFLLGIFRKGKTGVLSLRIPRNPGRSLQDFRVTLTPKVDEDVASNRSSCIWHPAFKTSYERLWYKLTYGFVDRTDLNCPNEDSIVTAKLNRLLSSNIRHLTSSATEFTITNGRGKVLTLPEGLYRVDIKPHVGLFTSNTTAHSTNPSLHHSTTLTWSGRRPYPVIRALH